MSVCLSVHPSWLAGWLARPEAWLAGPEAWLARAGLAGPGWLSLRPGWLSLRPGWLSLRPGAMGGSRAVAPIGDKVL